MMKIVIALSLMLTSLGTANSQINSGKSNEFAFHTACLTAAAWNEARGRPDIEIIAVMHVIKTRVNLHKFKGNNVCEVVLAKGQFQLSPAMRKLVVEAARSGKVKFDLTKSIDRIKFNKIVALSAIVLNGHSKDPTNGATHFFSPKLRKIMGLPAMPGWAKKLQQTKVLGEFHFYREV